MKKNNEDGVSTGYLEAIWKYTMELFCESSKKTPW